MKTIKTIIVIIISIGCFIAWFCFLLSTDMLDIIIWGSWIGGMIIAMIAGSIIDPESFKGGGGGCECCGTPGCF